MLKEYTYSYDKIRNGTRYSQTKRVKRMIKSSSTRIRLCNHEKIQAKAIIEDLLNECSVYAPTEMIKILSRKMDKNINRNLFYNLLRDVRNSTEAKLIKIIQ